MHACLWDSCCLLRTKRIGIGKYDIKDGIKRTLFVITIVLVITTLLKSNSMTFMHVKIEWNQKKLGCGVHIDTRSSNRCEVVLNELGKVEKSMWEESCHKKFSCCHPLFAIHWNYVLTTISGTGEKRGKVWRAFPFLSLLFFNNPSDATGDSVYQEAQWERYYSRAWISQLGRIRSLQVAQRSRVHL